MRPLLTFVLASSLACATGVGGVLPIADGGDAQGDGGLADAGAPIDGGGPADGGVAVDGGLPDGGFACGVSGTCPSGQRCYFERCIPDRPCAGDPDCQDDTYCQEGHCVPYGMPPRGETNVTCNRVVPAGLLAPRIACEWLRPEASDPFPSHRQVLSTPLVVDFNFDGRRVTDDPTFKPSIVVTTYDGTDGECGLAPMQTGVHFGVIRVLDGRTCEQQFVIPSSAAGPHVNGAATPALGDLDGDGRAEIVTLSAQGGVVAYRFDAQATPPAFVPLWTSHTADGQPHNPLAGLCMWTGVSIADLDDDGLPEVIVEGYVYDSTGKLLDASAGELNAAGSHGTGQFAVLADVDADGTPELVSARRLLRWNRAQKRFDVAQTYAYARGYVAVADFGTVTAGRLDRSRLDGVPEIAVVSQGNAWIMAQDGTVVFGPVALPGSSGGGPPTIGDFDHDGRPELAAAGSDSYTVFDPDCVAGADARYCPTATTNGILWSSPSQDHSSNITGSSLFDFEGDGVVEAVYADECYARVYDGRSGEVLFSQPHSSCTWNEYPVVADVAGDFRSRLVVPSNENCAVSCPAVDPNFKGLRCLAAADCPSALPCDSGFCRCTTDAQCNAGVAGAGFVCRAPPSGVPGTGLTCRAAYSEKRGGVRVFADVLDRWASSRPIWNQHVYTVTNVSDRGLVPRTSQVRANWREPGLNNFRMNVQGTVSPTAAPDLTARARASAAGACGATPVTLTAEVCNRGTAPVGDGIPVSFSVAGGRVCAASTEVAIAPGTCAPVSCDWAGAPAGTTLVRVGVDEGADGGVATECVEGNNTATLTVVCRPR